MFRILLVEDDRALKEILKLELTESFPSIIIEEASNGKKAREMIDSFCPHLALIDIRLPDESGLRVAKELKAKCPDTAIAILTSYDFPEYEKAALELGVSHYFIKTRMGRDEIDGMINSLLNNS